MDAHFDPLRPAPAWASMGQLQRMQCESMALDYRDFLSKAKTEWETVNSVVKRAAETGFASLRSVLDGRAEPGRKLMAMHHGRAAVLAVLGAQTPDQLSVIVAHADSPRLDLKPQPVFEKEGAALLATDMYGMLHKHHWFGTPLALHGRVALAGGQVVELVVGENPEDPVLTIPDLLPHLNRQLKNKTMAEAFPARRLNIFCGLLPDETTDMTERVKAGALAYFIQHWDIREEDLVSAEIAAVPAGPARDIGLDRSCIGGYGQDDRAGVYAGLWALLQQHDPARTCVLLLIDREETDNDGPGSARSRFFETAVADLLAIANADAGWRGVRRALMYAQALSADVDAALDPDRPEEHDPHNAARLGCGPALVRYSGSAGKSGTSEARPEYLAWLRRLLHEAGLPWQTGAWGWAETGGAGTAARFLANHGMDVAELGVPLLSMHSPMEIVSKADLFLTAKAYAAFFAAE